jgi:signal recognition particle subunit SRP9
MYKTFSAIILNRFETLNLRLLSQMANIPRAPTSTAAASGSAAATAPIGASGGLLSPPNANTRAGSPGVSGEEDDPMGGEAGTGAGASAGQGAGAGVGAGGKAGAGKGAGGKKKKKGKK